MKLKNILVSALFVVPALIIGCSDDSSTPAPKPDPTDTVPTPKPDPTDTVPTPKPDPTDTIPAPSPVIDLDTCLLKSNSVSISAEEQSITFIVESNRSYTVSSESSWMTVSSDGRSTADYTVVVDVDANTDVVNGREGTLNVVFADSASTTLTFTVTQAAAIPAPVPTLTTDSLVGVWNNTAMYGTMYFYANKNLYTQKGLMLVTMTWDFDEETQTLTLTQGVRPMEYEVEYNFETRVITLTGLVTLTVEGTSETLPDESKFISEIKNSSDKVLDMENENWVQNVVNFVTDTTIVCNVPIDLSSYSSARAYSLDEDFVKDFFEVSDDISNLLSTEEIAYIPLTSGNSVINYPVCPTGYNYGSWYRKSGNASSATATSQCYSVGTNDGINYDIAINSSFLPVYEDGVNVNASTLEAGTYYAGVRLKVVDELGDAKIVNIRFEIEVTE